jgi:hypothetical protein
LYETSVLTPQITQPVSVYKTSPFVLLREILAVYCKNHAKCVNVKVKFTLEQAMKAQRGVEI